MKFSGGKRLSVKKATVLIVDGYNIIYAWPELIQLKAKALAASRQGLVDIMVNYSAYSGQQVYIVFDGQGAADTLEYTNGITICYTREGETADQYIERMVGEEALVADEIYVATSDYAQQQTILGRGAHRMSSRELYLQVQKMWTSFTGFQGTKTLASGRLEARLGSDVRATLERMRRGK